MTAPHATAGTATPAGNVVVVGAGGMLGGAVRRELERRGATTWHPRVPWHDADGAVAAILATCAEAAEASDGDWAVAWCAGAGVVGAQQSVLDTELAVVRRLVDAWTTDSPAPTSLFYASSAGGVYGGSVAPPFTELTVPAPLGAYGRAKLAAEQEVARLVPRVPVLVGRIANLYGPGQDLGKNQGLVSALCRSHVLREPVGVYVSLDTLRDYLYVDDAGSLVVDAHARLAASGDVTAPVVKILASHQAASIAHLLGLSRRVLGGPVLVRMASSDLSRQQSRDLRLRSVVWPELDHRPLTTLATGIHRTAEDVRASLVAPH
ncbi:NAD(P)-dependent oxidoreductase [Cellulomonas sp. KH9]|uniref:NAD-dependent epimerase/dehydratase family protein n=1 Tax=Cellulomonas sp. KH9 TaxID=1855324 RepID=UPI0008E09582|nr:NAD-dependent epimerase/dehydratase family protein [Cellulomonas sp. KH9]SFK55611.1 UDP-glucose 4-epimerase [Cellulomonas sp. KH9]